MNNPRKKKMCTERILKEFSRIFSEGYLVDFLREYSGYHRVYQELNRVKLSEGAFTEKNKKLDF